MLVLSRKVGEQLRIGEQVRVTVVSTSRGQVRLAVEAPDTVSIHREEVFQRIAQANREAAEAARQDLDVLHEAPLPEPGGELG